MYARAAKAADRIYDLIYRAAFNHADWATFCNHLSEVVEGARVAIRGHTWSATQL
jgi:hypothetical protein